MPKQKLDGKVVAITGASGGIGAEVALQSAAKGATPILLARSVDNLEKVRRQIKERTEISALVYELDVSDVNAVETTFKEVIQKTGRIDILVNNAGFGVFDYFEEASMRDIESMFQVNVIGLMACTKTLLPYMIQAGSGHIINIASLAGKISTPKSTVYSSTKHAVLGFTNGLRMEVSDKNIDVTSVNPGPIDTNFFNIADQTGDYVKNVAAFMLKPEKVAAKIVLAMESPVREINLPYSMNAGSKLYQMFPRVFEAVAGNFLKFK